MANKTDQNQDEQNPDEKGGDEGNEEQFVAVETDDKGQPLNGGQADAAAQKQGDPDDDDDDEREGAEEEDDDERTGHDASRETETIEERRARRQRERRTKRIRDKTISAAKDRQIQHLTSAFHDLREQVTVLQGRTVQYDENLLKGQLANIESQLVQARDTMAACVKGQDGEGVAEVTEIQFQLRDQKRNIELLLQRAAAHRQRQAQGGQGQQPRQQRQQSLEAPPVSPIVIGNAAAWAKQNKWFDPNGRDKDSRIVTKIDNELHDEGLDPESDDYWEELTARVHEELPHRAPPRRNGNGSGNGHQQNNGSQQNGNGQRKAGGPKMTSTQSAQRKLRPNEVYVSPERKKAMQDAGHWDDLTKRNAMLKEYAKYDAEHPKA